MTVMTSAANDTSLMLRSGHRMSVASHYESMAQEGLTVLSTDACKHNVALLVDIHIPNTILAPFPKQDGNLSSRTSA